uniref:Uncharacterized protein n=1 Tax=Oncorhynchus tshawytscha TaxID=74940 RepID=A0AAZ3SE67_ONCTS
MPRVDTDLKLDFTDVVVAGLDLLAKVYHNKKDLSLYLIPLRECLLEYSVSKGDKLQPCSRKATALKV